MLRKILPLMLALVGTGAGVAAGLVLMPSASPDHGVAADPTAGHQDTTPAAAAVHAPPDHAAGTSEYVKMTNQFVVPIMGTERVEALVVASLSVEVATGNTEAVYQREPKLRDVFLQVMFDHANIGGFEGAFTSGERMEILRSALLDAARSVLGSDVRDILITEMARQDAA